MPSEVVSSRSVFKGKAIEVVVEEVRLSGKVVSREVVRHPGAVAIVALAGDNVILVRQWRHAPGEEVLEVPAGKLDVQGESPEECASRELMEETGYTAGTLRPLMTGLSSPGFSDEWVHLFLAPDARRQADPPQDDDGEPIAVELMPFVEAARLASSGYFRDLKTALGICLAYAVVRGKPS